MKFIASQTYNKGKWGEAFKSGGYYYISYDGRYGAGGPLLGPSFLHKFNGEFFHTYIGEGESKIAIDSTYGDNISTDILPNIIQCFTKEEIK